MKTPFNLFRLAQVAMCFSLAVANTFAASATAASPSVSASSPPISVRGWCDTLPIHTSSSEVDRILSEHALKLSDKRTDELCRKLHDNNAKLVINGNTTRLQTASGNSTVGAVVVSIADKFIGYEVSAKGTASSVIRNQPSISVSDEATSAQDALEKAITQALIVLDIDSMVSELRFVRSKIEATRLVR